MDKFLEIHDLVKYYGSGESRVKVLQGITAGVEKGHICVVLGSSGCGKSTLLNIIGGIEKPDGGYVSIGGEKLADMSERKLTQYRRKHLGYVFQFYNLIPNLTVRENIEVGAYLGSNTLDVDELMKTLGLWEHRNKIPNQLSGGQQQRTAIGRAIVKNPDILLCDEPTGALDSATGIQVLKLLWDFCRHYHKTVILITHNQSIAQIADRVIYVRDGLIEKIEDNPEPKDPQEVAW